MQVLIETLEQDPERQSGYRAQYKTVAECQSGSLEDHAVVVDTPYSKGRAYNTASAHEGNRCQQPFTDHAQDNADFPDLLKLSLNFRPHKYSFEKAFEPFAVSLLRCARAILAIEAILLDKREKSLGIL